MRVPKVIRMLEDVSAVVSSLDDSQKVLDSLVKLVAETMDVENCSIMLIELDGVTLRIAASRGLEEDIARAYKGRLGEGIAGWVAAQGAPLLVPDIEKDRRFGGRPTPRRKRYRTRSLLSVPLMLGGRPVGVLNVNTKVNGAVFNATDQAVLMVVARAVTMSLDRAHMLEIVKQKELMDVEIQAARRIQELILPRVRQFEKNIETAAMNLPALRVAGDFYDMIDSPGGKLWVVVGDVCSKGLAASLYMARVVSYFRALARYRQSAAGLLRGVNDLVATESSDNTFATACVLMLDKSRERITVCTAGHQAPLLYRPEDGAVEAMEVEGGPPLGVEEKATFVERTEALRPGHSVLLYTDGVSEARNARGELFGVERLERIMKKPSRSCSDLLDSIVSAVCNFGGTQQLQDDLTLFVVRRLPLAG